MKENEKERSEKEEKKERDGKGLGRMRRGKIGEKRRGEGEKKGGEEEKRRKKKNKNRESSARDAPFSPGAFPSTELGNNITPIKGRLGKNTTPTCKRTAALTPNLQKDP